MSDEEDLDERELALATLRQRMKNLLDSMALLEVFLKKYKPEEHLGQVPLRLAKLEEFFAQFFDVTAKLEAFSSERNPISVQNERFDFETRYYSLKVVLQSKLPKTDPLPSTSSAAGNTVSSASTGCHIRYPELPLLKFSGRAEDWVSFRDSFTAGVINRKEIRDVDKLQYLKGLVQGDAARLIGHIEISEEGYRTAWKLLTRRYESKRRLIFCHLQGLYETKPMRRESSEELLRVIDSFEEHLSNLKRLGEATDRWSSSLVYHLYIRLDTTTKREWDRHCNAVDAKEYTDQDAALEETMADDMPTYVDMLRFLQGYAKVLQSVSQSGAGQNDGQKGSRDSRIRFTSHFSSDSRQSFTSQGCYQCGQSHLLCHCPDFRRMSVSQRYEVINRNGLCSNCLRTTKHIARMCSGGHCLKCSRKHNTLLHDNRFERQRGQQNQQQAPSGQNWQQSSANQGQQPSAGISNQSSQQGRSQPVSGQAQVSHQQEGQQSSSCVSYSATETSSEAQVVLLPTAFVNMADTKGNLVQARCVLDSASQCHFISNSLCQKLRLPRKRTPSSISVSGIGRSSTKVTHFVVVEVSSLHSAFRARLRMLVLPDVTVKLPINDINIADWQVPEHVCLGDPTFHISSSVDVIIGAEYFFQALQYGRIELGVNLPLLQNTLFGWVVAGGCGHDLAREALCNFSQMKTLDDLVCRFWQLETCHDLRGWSADERACEQHFLANTARTAEGRYVVKLPFKRDLVSQLKDNRYNAERRFYALERRLEANPELKLQYHQFIAEYEELGHMRVVGNEELDVKPQYFLPHHAVLKPESTTTKLRTVFDASCKSKSGLSLNDVLLAGPTIQDTLVAIILRFRMHPFVVSADVSKMFRQILVDPADQPLQRILWRFSTDDPLKVYQLLTVTYGTNCAPFLSTRILQKLSEDEAEKYPLAAPVVRKSFYVDDMLTGSDSLRLLKQIISQVSGMMESAGLSLRKWSSNCQEALADIPLELREQTKVLDLDHESSVTMLGLRWDTASDEFRFKQPKWTHEEVLTKRIVLAQLASLFDPLGLIGPAIMKAKIFMQALWKLEIGWDNPLPSAFQDEWREYQQQIQKVGRLSIPRFVLSNKKASVYELHGFCDASQDGYGAALYLRSITPDGYSTVRLLTAKSRVAPINTKSIPRLELCAALLLSHLLEKASECLDIKADMFLWTDSTIVLSWIAASPSSWKIFVANRVAEIQELTPHAVWNHVPSEENPADLISRGLDVETLSKSSLWWNGPSWLASQDTPWPPKFVVPDKTKEESPEFAVKKAVALPTIVGEEEEEFVSRFSTLRSLLIVATWGLRFAHNCRVTKNQRRCGPFTVEEKQHAFTKLVGHIQWQCFQPEIRALQQNKAVLHSSKLRFLKPRLVDGLIRVGGRLHYAKIAIDAKHPIVLPGKHHLAKLIARSEHFKTLHGGPQLLLSTIRQQFWPLGGRDLVRQLVHECITCTRANPRMLEQLMGDLPHHRVTKGFVFEHVGIDFAGPMYIKSGARFSQPIKAYVAVFVCLVTKAAHLELVMDLSTPAFLAALRRFISRRGKPANIYCDNGGNLQGASTQLSSLRQTFISQQHKNAVRCFCEPDNIQFHFIPPRSPSFGGLWEACVKSMKFHLRRIVGNANLSKEEFETVLAQVEACLNSRPITPLSNDPSDLQALTPGHFLIGRPLNAVPEPDLTEAPSNRLTAWERAQQIAQHFWQRWQQEYLTSLQQSYRWSTTTKNLAIGSVVIIKEETLPPLKWQLARVVSVHPGRDGLVRVATVRTARGTYKRAIGRLCLLPVEVDAQQVPAIQSQPQFMAAGSEESSSPKASTSAQQTAASRINQADEPEK